MSQLHVRSSAWRAWPGWRLAARTVVRLWCVILLGAASRPQPVAATADLLRPSAISPPLPPTFFQVEPACSPDASETAVQEFIDALNRGDLDRLDGLVAQQKRFQWYSTDAPGQRFDREARDRSSLLPYLASRHADGEVLELRRFQLNSIANGYGNVEFDLVRSADDLPPTAYVGKGALDCDSQPPTTAVWSMARVETTSVDRGPADCRSDNGGTSVAVAMQPPDCEEP